MQPVVRRVWAPIGQRPTATVAPDYEWLSMYAAAHRATGESFWLSLPRLDGEMAQLFLDEFARQHAPEGKRIVLSWDGAPERITLMALPAYRPELNPAEHLGRLYNEKLRALRAAA